jgi:hypothetical protein
VNLPTAQIRHLGGHHCHGRNVGVQWQTRHVNDGVRDIGGLHSWLRPNAAVGLRHPFGCRGRQVVRGGANVDLAAGVATAILLSMASLSLTRLVSVSACYNTLKR